MAAMKKPLKLSIPYANVCETCCAARICPVCGAHITDEIIDGEKTASRAYAKHVEEKHKEGDPLAFSDVYASPECKPSHPLYLRVNTHVSTNRAYITNITGAIHPSTPRVDKGFVQRRGIPDGLPERAIQHVRTYVEKIKATIAQVPDAKLGVSFIETPENFKRYFPTVEHDFNLCGLQVTVPRMKGQKKIQERVEALLKDLASSFPRVPE